MMGQNFNDEIKNEDEPKNGNRKDLVKGDW